MRILAIDFSGAADVSVQRRKIWIADAAPGHQIIARCGLTRDELGVELVARSAELDVVGLDFGFAFPEWFWPLVGARSAPELWEIAARDGDGWLSDCPWPFWGRPGSRREIEDARAYRETERAQRAAGLPVKSVFQIGGAGAVGTASIRGMALLTRLRNAGFAVWPFDAPRSPLVVEIYPRAFAVGVVKTDRIARRRALDRLDAAVEPATRQAAVDGDDAFDAVISAAGIAAACTSSSRP